MHMIRRGLCWLLIGGTLLLFSGCIGAAQGGPADTSENKAAIAASFNQEDGAVLCGSIVRFSFGDRHIDHPLDDNGELRISGLPKAGDLFLTILDQQEQMQGG